ncbi:aldo/keto reductase [Marinimicrobium sp. ABcell2]|uniref:aldo/keto reductase n=1 Tax=Marinimicrobium sp. ABcell2 TaxID=3069751 RepID=UPI0027B7B07A|nr:aldo/keto reductase [Marinimicrobium sp. ABcell2]MDQ2076482.1 aldo/keto reductase [Marinimicrobium sp. ABcell2]
MSELPLRPLGRTGLNISPVGLGTVKLGRNQGLKHPQSFELPTDKEAQRLLDCARDLGINLLDTAAAYGESEARLGQLLHGRRQDWIICTKAGEEFEAGQSRFDFTPEHMRTSVERSLRRLRSDYLDLVLVHSDGNDRDLIERYGTLQALQELKQAGLIRACGVSSKTLDGGLLLAQYADALMVACNPIDREQLPVIEACQRVGTGVLIKKALASGHLCSQAAEDTDPVQASLDFLFAQPGVDSVVIGTLNPKHLRDNVAKALKALTGERQPKEI